MAGPKVGQEVNGYIFKGGNPNSQQSWESLRDHYNPTKDMSGMEKFLAGAGSGLTDIARKGTNLALPDRFTPEWASDESIDEQTGLDEQLLDTGAGLAGNIVGATAATLPLTGGITAGLKGVAGLASKGSHLQRAASALAAPLQLAKAGGRGSVAAPMARAAIEGGVGGAVAANPGERLEGAGTGAALSTALSGGGKLLKRTMAKGLVKPTKAAQELMDEGMFVPITAAADEHGLSGGIKSIYREGITNIPGGGALKMQTMDALDEARARVMKKAVPDWADGVLGGAKDRLDEQEIMRRLDDFWTNDAYAGVKKYTYNTSHKWVDSAGDLSKVAKQRLMKVLGGKSEMSGAELLTAKQDLNDLIGAAKLRKAKIPLEQARKHIDDIIEDQLGASGSKTQAGKELAKFKTLKEPYKAYMNLQKTVADAAEEGGEFTFDKLAKTSARKAGIKSASKGEGALQETATQYHNALGKPLLGNNIWRTAAVLGMAGGSALNPAVLPAVGGGALALSRKGTQNALMGNTATQKYITNALRRYGDKIGKAGYGARTLAVQGEARSDR